MRCDAASGDWRGHRCAPLSYLPPSEEGSRWCSKVIRFLSRPSPLPRCVSPLVPSSPLPARYFTLARSSSVSALSLVPPPPPFYPFPPQACLMPLLLLPFAAVAAVSWCWLLLLLMLRFAAASPHRLKTIAHAHFPTQ